MTKPVLVVASSNPGKLAEFRELLQGALPQGAVDVRPQPAGVTVGA